MTWYMGPHHRAPLQPDSLVPCCPEDCLDLDRRLAGPGRGTREQRLWQVLSDPLTQTGVLGAILSTQQITPRLLRAACRHPALPMSALVALGERYPDQFLANPAVRLQRATSPDWLFTLPYQTICAVIRSPLCPSSALERLSRDRRLPLGVRATAAGQPKLTTEQMARFMRHATTVRASLAQNPSLPPELEVRLARDRRSQVRAAIAERTQDPELLTRLSRDPSLYRVRVAVAQNPASPPSVRDHLSKSRLHQIQAALRDADLQRHR